jgi:hypothetical protein
MPEYKTLADLFAAGPDAFRAFLEEEGPAVAYASNPASDSSPLGIYIDCKLVPDVIKIGPTQAGVEVHQGQPDEDLTLPYWAQDYQKKLDDVHTQSHTYNQITGETALLVYERAREVFGAYAAAAV